MKKEERLLSYNLSKELVKEELNKVAGAGSHNATSNATWSEKGGSDASADYTFDA